MNMYPNIIALFSFLMFCINCYSQSITIEVRDSLTGEPIPYVNVYSPRTMEGTITNDDGQCLIFNFEDTLALSYVGYKKFKRKFTAEDISLIIFLVPEPTMLSEVKIYSLDLKEKLRQVLDGLNEFYVVDPLNYQCTYKEKFYANNTLRRLFQIQLEWYNKNGTVFDPSKPFYKDNQIAISSIDYSKIMSDSIKENVGYIENSYFFQFLSINYYLYIILVKGNHLIINNIIQKGNEWKINFTGNIQDNDSVPLHIENGELYFDYQMDCITGIIMEINYGDFTAKKYSRIAKFPYWTQTYSHSLRIGLKKGLDSKLILGFLKTQVFGKLFFNNSSFDFLSTQELLVNNVEKDKRITKKERIDLELPFYESIPRSGPISDNVLQTLTQEELDFINN